MTALDTDVLTLYLRGNEEIMSRVFALPWDSLAFPIVVVEEVLRGRLDAVRKTQTKNKASQLIDNYQLFQTSVQASASFRLLPYTEAADLTYQSWRGQKIRVGAQDLRIAAICVAQGATLVTRNRQDFSQLQGLTVVFW